VPVSQGDGSRLKVTEVSVDYGELFQGDEREESDN